MSAIMPQTKGLVRTVPVMARVLIVEDDPLVRSAMVTDLSQRAHAVRTAATALDGIGEVSHDPPEVIVLDLGLPDLDRQQALQMMRAVTETPVIVATARDEEAENIRLLNAGADDYLVKPFSGEHLAARISPCCAGPGWPARPRSSPWPGSGSTWPGGRPCWTAAASNCPPGIRPARLPGRQTRRPDLPAGTAHPGVAPVLRRGPDHRRAHLVAAAQTRQTAARRATCTRCAASV